MVTIKVIGTTPPCAKCKRAEQEARKAAERWAGRVQIVKIDALSPEAQSFGIVMAPTVIVDGKIVGAGKVVPAAQLETLLEELLGG
ncbi:MAG: thioredoxin family protein [Chloroflexi bacterium]|nr:thioredoxin family protein [Chloroflexota bacterium]